MGARRVLVRVILRRCLREREYRSYILIDFGNADQELLDVFLHDKRDLDLFFAKLGGVFGVVLYPRESLVIFDEVQQFPQARQMIEYLVADGRYDYLETGFVDPAEEKCAGHCDPVGRRSY